MTSPGPLVSHIYTADPSAHAFEGRLYVYVSHDVDTGVPPSGDGDQFDMQDYHVLSMDHVDGDVMDHGAVLRLDDVPWASRQLWSNDVALRNGVYYMYFPAKDPDGLFRIGVATADEPAGAFRPESSPIEGCFSIDPCAFEDADRQHYLYFGGIRGGQLHAWRTGRYDPEATEPDGDEPALGPRVARLRPDMLGVDEQPREVAILDEGGRPIRASDLVRRFFEAPWVHRHRGLYYLSYSTGETGRIVYATSESPYGPYRYRGVVLSPVVGWTTHHSIVRFRERWYLIYHDASLSGGRDHLRCVKVAPLRGL